MWLGGLGETGRGEFGGFWFLYMQFWIDLGCYQGYNVLLHGSHLVLLSRTRFTVFTYF
jgi:hypothetical protein